jgi:hypothetical protein
MITRDNASMHLNITFDLILKTDYRSVLYIINFLAYSLYFQIINNLDKLLTKVQFYV